MRQLEILSIQALAQQVTSGLVYCEPFQCLFFANISKSESIFFFYPFLIKSCSVSCIFNPTIYLEYFFNHINLQKAALFFLNICIVFCHLDIPHIVQWASDFFAYMCPKTILKTIYLLTHLC